MITHSEYIPKKCRDDAKHCILCKQHGDVHMTHSTTEYPTYEKDGTPKKAFVGKSMQHTPCSNNMTCEHNSAYAQLSVKIAKLEKSNRKLKHTIKKHKCNRKSDSKDSDLS